MSQQPVRAPHPQQQPVRPLRKGRAGSVTRFPIFPGPAHGLDRAASLALVAVALLGLGLRLWHVNSLGYNSDEAVYAGQGAALASDPELTRFFPIIRAHPMLFQFVLALAFHFGVNDLFGRLVSVGFGIATILVVAKLGQLLYGRWVGIVAALFIAVMPYHVVVTRQVLLYGPMVFFTTLTLYLVARFAASERPAFLAAAGASLGLVFLAKETGFVVAAAVYAFLALTPRIRVRIRDLALSVACLLTVMISYPISLALAGGGASDKAQGYVIWQLFRRPNHTWEFYPQVVPPAMGWLVLGAALLGLVLLRRERSWRETLLIAWILVPIAVFQLWPVKGFQYLLPTAPAFAILAARTLIRWRPRRRASTAVPAAGAGRVLAVARPVAVAAIVLSLLIPSWQKVQPSTSTEFLAGSGGIPGGRETGDWIRAHVPQDAMFLAVGPSMANIIQFYGHRKAYGLSVSPNPLHRNPSYEAIRNPDNLIRTGELQYLVFDTFSAARSPFFGEKLKTYVDKYHGHEVHSESVTVTRPDGSIETTPVIVIYEVRP
jgi:Dolichyl-phosphate-mannose-protein mannosyltransferase